MRYWRDGKGEMSSCLLTTDNSKIVSSHSVGYYEVLKTSLVNLMSYFVAPSADCRWRTDGLDVVGMLDL